MKEIHIKAPGTIANLGPGFDIFALALENPYVELKLRLNNTKSVTIEPCNKQKDMPLRPEDNTGGLAILDLLKKIRSQTGVALEFEKEMKVGAGLGSSGACASACIYGLNRLLELNLSFNEMIDIARKGEVASGGIAHADNVAGAMLGGFVLIKSYNPLDATRMDVPEIPVVVGILKKSQRTTRSLIPESLELNDVKEQLSQCARVVYSIQKGDLEEFGKAINKDNISEPARSKSIPGYYDIKAKLLEAGAYGCNISGGGSSIFAICEKEHTKEIADVMRAEFSRRRLGKEIIITKASNEGVKEISSD